MLKTRKIRQTLRSQPSTEGAGVRLHRVFGGPHDASIFDPFLLLDDFRNDRPQDYAAGFPWHPHRGIETITYMLHGTVAHEDSMGHSGTITDGDIQWMTAGNGILHQEMPVGSPDGRMGGFQLWANLPRANKMMNPRYQDIKNPQIPTVTLEQGVTVRVICGEIGGVRGPVENIVIDPRYLDITVAPETRVTFPTPPGHTVFAYVFEGMAAFCDEQDPFTYQHEENNHIDMQSNRWLDNRTLILFEDGEQIQVTTDQDPVRFLLISGQPINEPIAWYGPIVMNTQEELRQAVEELHRGTFIKTSI